MNSSEPRKLSFSSIISNLDDNEEKLQEYERQQKEYEQQESLDRYRKSGVPEKFYDTSLDSYETETQEEIINKQTVVNYTKNPMNRILILCGKNGNGKSHLASGVIRECGGVYILSSDLCVEYESGNSYHAKRTKQEVLKYYATVKGVLVIDECCKYFLNTEMEKFLLAYIICARYENNLSTVLVTNGYKKEFIEFLGKSVFDRLTEVCTTLEFTGISKRKFRRAV